MLCNKQMRLKPMFLTDRSQSVPLIVSDCCWRGEGRGRLSCTAGEERHIKDLKIT